MLKSLSKPLNVWSVLLVTLIFTLLILCLVTLIHAVESTFLILLKSSSFSLDVVSISTLPLRKIAVVLLALNVSSLPNWLVSSLNLIFFPLKLC